MPETDIGQAEVSDYTNQFVDFKVQEETTDASDGLIETRWQTTTWSKHYGFYKTVPELKIAIDTKATWVLGAGFEADEATTLLLGTIKGNGKDTFNSILKNQITVAMIDGDSYAEIIRSNDGVMINLKPLDPSSMVSFQNKAGQYTRYEQVNKNKDPLAKFEPENIFHMSRERRADEIHGISVIPAVENIILARNEAMADWKIVLHRNVYPVNLYHLDTDEATEISAMKAKVASAKSKGEDIFVPKGGVERDPGGISNNATMDALATIAQYNDYFFQAVGVPQVIVGNAKAFTDASAKIVYLAFEQNVKAEQLKTEEDCLNQLGVEIDLTFPASLQTDAISDSPTPEEMTVEEEPIEEATQPNDTTTELEGKK